ncbi:MAG TPA: HAMP domain-containing sensor histidine kinase [Candidatus Saccharimonadales bacterium]|nr:HAMP domain-containing sensor histidine kinase [Candidatus Saccharimonadales bacterium]
MEIPSRNKAIAFFIVLGACSVAFALALNITWMIRWQEVGMIVLGIIFFGFIITGVTLNTIFLVREMRRSEQHDSFINAVTHELKTPIASIRLYLETLQSRELNEAQRKKFYGIMLEDTDRLINTVDQVLRAGHLGQKNKKNFQRLDLGEVVRDCTSLAKTRHHLEDGNIRFVDYTLSAPLVQGDPEELRSAVGNLLENAVKYSHGNIAITIEILDEGKDLLVRVTDKGQGIPQGELKRIFRRFYRVNERLRQRVKGTGLGLFIVGGIARRHGGRAYASSEGEGRGATVTLRLPRDAS